MDRLSKLPLGCRDLYVCGQARNLVVQLELGPIPWVETTPGQPRGRESPPNKVCTNAVGKIKVVTFLLKRQAL